MGITTFVGFYPTLLALQTAHPVGKPGDYGIVAVIGGVDKKYIWDDDAGDWADSGAGTVWSVHGRTGNVIAAMGDYTAGQVGALTPAEVAAVAQAIENAGEKTMTASVATADEMKSALDALSASTVYENAIITLTANISNNGGYNPAGNINKNVIFKSDGTRRTWTWGNGYNLYYTKTGKTVFFEDITLTRSGVTSTEGIKTQGANSSDRVFTRIVFSNAVVSTDSQICQASFWGYQEVYFIGSLYTGTGTNSSIIRTSANSYHTQAYGSRLHVIQSETTGTLAYRGDNPSLIEVFVHSSIISDGGSGVNAWRSFSARHATPPIGQFTVYIDDKSVVSRNSVAGSADTPDFIYNRNRANVIAPATGDTLNHNGARAIHATIPAAGGTASATTPIEAGYYDGQILSIIWTATAGATIYTIPNSGNVNLEGGYSAIAVGQGLTVQWDATAGLWREISRIQSTGCTFSGRRTGGAGDSNTASGQNAFSVGASNISSGSQAFTAGNNNSASGDNSFALGQSNTASSSRAGAIGQGNQASSENAFAMGYRARTERYASFVHAAGYRAGLGDSQFTRDIVRATIAAGATGDLLINATHKISLVEDSVIAFRILASARDSSGDAAGWIITGVIKRTGAGFATIVGTPTVTVLAKDDAAWDLAVAADSVSAALKITGTADDTNETYFSAVVETSQVK